MGCDNNYDVVVYWGTDNKYSCLQGGRCFIEPYARSCSELEMNELLGQNSMVAYTRGVSSKLRQGSLECQIQR